VLRLDAPRTGISRHELIAHDFCASADNTAPACTSLGLSLDICNFWVKINNGALQCLGQNLRVYSDHSLRRRILTFTQSQVTFTRVRGIEKLTYDIQPELHLRCITHHILISSRSTCTWVRNFAFFIENAFKFVNNPTASKHVKIITAISFSQQMYTHDNINANSSFNTHK